MSTHVLCILDGWGEGDTEDLHNAVIQANTPIYDRLRQDYPTTFISASGLDVGLPNGQIGNSEVGHMNIGAGRIIYQDLPLINDAIQRGDLAKNDVLQDIITNIGDKTIHLCGLLSDGGVHGHIDHMIFLANFLTDNGCCVCIHGFGDGRDVAPKSLIPYLEKLASQLKSAKITTICGRYYAMDRDNNFDRTSIAVDMIKDAKGHITHHFIDAVQQSYDNDIYDEFIQPIIDESYSGMAVGDAIIALNFRADRMRQILSVFGDKNHEYYIGDILSYHIGMVNYSETLNQYYRSLFPPKKITNPLGAYLSDLGLKQLRLAESEKYAHVTFFFNGGVEDIYEGEERILVPSPKIATYDLQPEMSAEKVTNHLVDSILSDMFDVIIVNYANPDMVGHTGNLNAVKKAVSFVDICLGRVIEALEKTQSIMLLTADHGNAEKMWEEKNNQPHTAHTTNLVPLILVGNHHRQFIDDNGILADLSPTLLDIMGLQPPDDMTGRSLIKAK